MHRLYAHYLLNHLMVHTEVSSTEGDTLDILLRAIITLPLPVKHELSDNSEGLLDRLSWRCLLGDGEDTTWVSLAPLRQHASR